MGGGGAEWYLNVMRVVGVIRLGYWGDGGGGGGIRVLRCGWGRVIRVVGVMRLRVVG